MVQYRVIAKLKNDDEFHFGIFYSDLNSSLEAKETWLEALRNNVLNYVYDNELIEDEDGLIGDITFLNAICQELYINKLNLPDLEANYKALYGVFEELRVYDLTWKAVGNGLVHAVQFDKNYFTTEKARQWMAKHKYKPIKAVHTTRKMYHYRIIKPSKKYTYSTKTLPNHVQLVIAYK